MIKLFRNIRRGLLNEGKTSKYFKYAIGEIVLVVIGILIALQVNNWNEKRKEVVLGQQYLTEMYNEILDDIFKIDGYVIRLKQNIKNHETALSTQDITKLPLDSLEMIITPVNLDFKINELTYDKMKSLGISALSENEELNEQVTNYYNHIVVFQKLFLKYIFEELRKYEDFFKYQQKDIDINSVLNNAKPYEFPSLYTESQEEFQESIRQNILQFILSTQGRNLILNDLEIKRYSLNALKSFQGSTIHLLYAVHNELKNNNPQFESFPELPEGYNFKEITVSEDDLKIYVGKYEFDKNTYLNISLENKQLYSQLGSNPKKVKLYPYETDKFFTKDFFEQFQFNRENGGIMSLTLLQRNQECKKVD